MRSLFILLPLFVAVLSGVGCEENMSPTSDVPKEGQVVERTFVHDDSLRSYLLYIPGAYDGEGNWPLVINYHGFSMTAKSQMEVAEMNALADEKRFLVAYPQGLLLFIPEEYGGIKVGWNYIGDLSENNDSEFSDALINDIQHDYSVDPRRVHTTGFSQGAAISFRVACSLPDKIASAAGVGLYLYLNENLEEYSDCNLGRSFSAMQIHGTADRTIPYGGMQLAGYTFSPVPEALEFWAKQNNCASEFSTTELEDLVESDSSTVSLIEYSNCDQGAEVVLYRVNDGGHTWPGGGHQPAGWGTMNEDFKASEVIWDFFERNPLP